MLLWKSFTKVVIFCFRVVGKVLFFISCPHRALDAEKRRMVRFLKNIVEKEATARFFYVTSQIIP